MTKLSGNRTSNSPSRKSLGARCNAVLTPRAHWNSASSAARKTPVSSRSGTTKLHCHRGMLLYPVSLIASKLFGRRNFDAISPFGVLQSFRDVFIISLVVRSVETLRHGQSSRHIRCLAMALWCWVNMHSARLFRM